QLFFCLNLAILPTGYNRPRLPGLLPPSPW
ncbi:metal-sulfur cluster biosynthetic enzyme, partial [Bacteroidales bacterium 6E]